MLVTCKGGLGGAGWRKERREVWNERKWKEYVQPYKVLVRNRAVFVSARKLLSTCRCEVTCFPPSYLPLPPPFLHRPPVYPSSAFFRYSFYLFLLSLILLQFMIVFFSFCIHSLSFFFLLTVASLFPHSFPSFLLHSSFSPVFSFPLSFQSFTLFINSI